jgi:hypothetical protein
MVPPSDPVPVEVDAWVLRCIFNRSLIMARAARGEFTIRPKKPNKKPSPANNPRYPKDTLQRMWVYEDKDGNEIVTAHWWFLGEKRLSPIDPKAIRVGNVRYVEHPEPAKKNPEQRFRYVWQRRIYGLYRKIRCRVCGPVAVIP